MKLLTMGLLAGAFMATSGVAQAGCYGDYDCAMGQECVKPQGSYQATGNCVTPSDEYGNARPDYSVDGNVKESKGCQWGTDCPVGFDCMKRTGELRGICVK
ncbi:hypothetical protein D5687_09495 [Guyparkeria sp. SCN-R1]|uniref:hypothetical protein n=1 Tax=Guyparkeria sp. SCN-R1 TaxID=2341113 RepID=UPI000F6510EB|nr:hypothetical protein [Guyparkeria sp. SCN-R1]RRQ20404.1 hypothetical protein D5687_09495 [Guyparkeria sp. SCN-R1]